MIIFFSISVCFAIDNSINVYSWGEFISNGSDGNMNVNEEFTSLTGIKVNYKTFQNNEELYAKISDTLTMLTTGGEQNE